MKYLIIDCNYLCHKARYSTGELKSNDIDTGVIFGFFIQILNMAEIFESNNLLFTWDSKKSLRKKIFPEYKKKRYSKPMTDEEWKALKSAFNQMNLLRKKILPALGFKNNFIQAGLEGDDLIAQLCIQYERKDEKVIIISSDHDLYQLLTNNISMFSNSKLYTLKKFEEEWELYPATWKKIKAIGGCFDKKTEILTNRGWIYFSQINKNDLVYSMDPNTQNASYQKIKTIIEYHYKGIMYKIKGSLIDLFITPDHEFLGNTTQSYNKTKAKNKFIQIKDIIKYKNYSIPITSKWVGKEKNIFILPKIIIQIKNRKSKTFRYLLKKEIEIKMEAWMAFLGIWLSDGYVFKNRNNKIGVIGISKTKDYAVKEIQKILNKLPFKWCKIKTGWTTNSVQLAQYLHPLGKALTKYIPQEFKDLSIKYLKILFKYLIICDGCISTSKLSIFKQPPKKYTSTTYYSSSKKLIDDVQEIAIKIGFSASIRKREKRIWNIKNKTGISMPNYTLKINKSKTLNLLKKEITLIHFNDIVYDVTTEPYHTLFVRRNGIAIWSGNCNSDEIPGIPGVAEKTVCKYLKGELKETTKAWQAITSENNTELIKRNHRLVDLPFPKTKELIIQKDELNIMVFKKMCKKYKFNSFVRER